MKALRLMSLVTAMAAIGVFVPVSLAAPLPMRSSTSHVPAPPATISASAGNVMPLTSGWHYNQNTGIDVIGTKLNVTDILVTGYTESYTGNSSAEVYDTDGIFNWYSPSQPWDNNELGIPS